MKLEGSGYMPPTKKKVGRPKSASNTKRTSVTKSKINPKNIPKIEVTNENAEIVKQAIEQEAKGVKNPSVRKSIKSNNNIKIIEESKTARKVKIDSSDTAKESKVKAINKSNVNATIAKNITSPNKNLKEKPYNSGYPELEITPFCLHCGTKNQTSLYKSYDFFNKTSKLPYCKDCLKNIIYPYFLKESGNRENLAFHNLLRSLNVAYIHEFFLAAIDNADKVLKKEEEKIIAEKIIAEKQKRALTGKDESDEEENNKLISIRSINSLKKYTEDNVDVIRESDLVDKKNDYATCLKRGIWLIESYFKNYNSLHDKNNLGSGYVQSSGASSVPGINDLSDVVRIRRRPKVLNASEIDSNKYTIVECDADELCQKWGFFEDEGLIYLENEYLDWVDKLGENINKKDTELLVKQICYSTYEIYQKRQSGDKTKEELQTLQNMLGNAGLMSASEKKSKPETIGLTIKDLEERAPVMECPPRYKDVDKYVQEIYSIAGCVCKAQGIENEYTMMADKILAPYNLDSLEKLETYLMGDEEKSNGGT